MYKLFIQLKIFSLVTSKKELGCLLNILQAKGLRNDGLMMTTMFSVQYWMYEDLLEKFIEHPIVDVLGASPVQFGDLFGVGAVRVERPELAARVAEQHEEVFGFGPRDLLQDPPLRFRVHGAGEHAVLYGV